MILGPIHTQLSPTRLVMSALVVLLAKRYAQVVTIPAKLQYKFFSFGRVFAMRSFTPRIGSFLASVYMPFLQMCL